MICPYLWNETEIKVKEAGKQEDFSYELEDGTPSKFSDVTHDESTMRNKYPFECAEDGCACFQNGKCQRR